MSLVCGCPSGVGVGAPEGEYCDDCHQIVQRTEVRGLDAVRQLIEVLPLPAVSWNYNFASGILMVLVDDELLYEGPETPQWRKMLEGTTNAALVYGSIDYIDAAANNQHPNAPTT